MSKTTNTKFGDATTLRANGLNLTTSQLAEINKQGRFDKAIVVLKRFYDAFTLRPHIIGYRLALVTTNNFDTFIADTIRDGYMTISLEGSKYTIYDSMLYNIIARYHQDLIHYDNRLTFSVVDELKTCDIQIDAIRTFMNDTGIVGTIHEDVLEIIYHDIVGQVKYYDTHGKYVVNQKEFVYTLFLSATPTLICDLSRHRRCDKGVLYRKDAPIFHKELNSFKRLGGTRNVCN